jgi:protein-S-isoprenylcysteine O-methyltransferase Ste14
LLYVATVVPREEDMLEGAFGEKYRRYKERVPAFSWALVLLLILEAVLIWKSVA